MAHQWPGWDYVSFAAPGRNCPVAGHFRHRAYRDSRLPNLVSSAHLALGTWHMEHSYLVTIFFPLGVYALAVSMPGPSFVVISRVSICDGAINGSAAAFGTTFVVAIYAVATVLGLSALVTTLPWMTATIQIMGGGYLLYLGVSLLASVFSAKTAPGMIVGGHVQPTETWGGSFRRGAYVSLGNPKMAAFFIGLFAPVMTDTIYLSAKLGLLCGIVLIDLLYHQLFAHIAAKGAGLAKIAGRWFDAVVGGFMTAFGIGLIMNAFSRDVPS